MDELNQFFSKIFPERPKKFGAEKKNEIIFSGNDSIRTF
jgi:hypothetical protein